MCSVTEVTLKLSAEERAMLSGELGAGVRKAMEIVVALGQIYGAQRLVEVGSVQVAARVVETGLHKMLEVGFDIGTVLSGFGTCPLAPIAQDDLRAIGRTNDAVLYGGRAWYTVRTEDTHIETFIEKLPSSASRDYGTPFFDLFQRYGGDFYKIDPLLFSPAEVYVNNQTSGRTFHVGELNLDMISKTLLK